MTASDPVKPTAPSLLPAQEQCSESNQPLGLTPLLSASGREPAGAQEAPGPDLASTSEVGRDGRPPVDQTRRETKKRDSKSSRKQANWLMNDPQDWVGRKVRSRRNFAIYSVSEVYKTGRVKLEKNWMTYLTDVQTVRTQYDTIC